MKRSPFPRFTRHALKAVPAALVLSLAAGSAFAGDPGDDSEGFHGYFRAGAGGSSAQGGRQSCFGLGGNTMRYRLGNECDAYFEGGLTKEMAKSDDGVHFLGTLWLQEYAPNSDISNGTVLETSLTRAYVQAKGLDFLNGGTAWVGKRHYIRPDIHMLDLQYTNLNGVGGGVDKINLGPGKFSYAFVKDSDNNVTDPTTGVVVNTTAALRHSFVYQDLPVNADGTLDLVASIISAKGEGKHNGWNFSAIHHQDKVLGGGNTVGLQYGVGPGTGAGTCCDRIGVAGATTLGSDVKRLRVFDSLWIQPTPQFSAEMVALWQRDKSDARGSTTWTTLGIRPVYALASHLKLQAELGTDRVTVPNGPALRLTKLTIAPTITAGMGYWSRPELRAFVTYGKWNDAATQRVNDANEGGAVYGSRTSGTSFGVQLETWF
jgi:maltoporin